MKKVRFYMKEFVIFGLKEARACIFAGSFLLLLILTNYIDVPLVSRADFLFVAALTIQFLMLLFKLETTDEAKTIFLFHIIGIALELYKTHPSVGSWTYPELGFFHVSTVPLYSGFMYAAIGSYIVQAWRILKLKLEHMPPYTLSLMVAIVVYVNFFTNHFIYDIRWYLFGIILILYWKTKVVYTVTTVPRKMPLVLGFILTAFFIWIAENIGTFTHAWQYPNQVIAWQAVSFHKVSSWSLLVIISFLLIAYLKEVKAKRRGNHEKSI